MSMCAKVDILLFYLPTFSDKKAKNALLLILCKILQLRGSASLIN